MIYQWNSFVKTSPRLKSNQQLPTRKTSHPLLLGNATKKSLWQLHMVKSNDFLPHNRCANKFRLNRLFNLWQQGKHRLMNDCYVPPGGGLTLLHAVIAYWETSQNYIINNSTCAFTNCSQSQTVCCGGTKKSTVTLSNTWMDKSVWVVAPPMIIMWLVKLYTHSTHMKTLNTFKVDGEGTLQGWQYRTQLTESARQSRSY